MPVSITIDNKDSLITTSLAVIGGISGILIARSKSSGFLKGAIWVIALTAVGAGIGYGVNKIR